MNRQVGELGEGEVDVGCGADIDVGGGELVDDEAGVVGVYAVV
ncbi:MAG: hypothetical protein AAB428_03450 [Patescibacteria group bacterium]